MKIEGVLDVGFVWTVADDVVNFYVVAISDTETVSAYGNPL